MNKMMDNGITHYIKVGPTDNPYYLETGNTYEKTQAIIKRDLEFRACEFSGKPNVPAQECVACKKTKLDAQKSCSVYQLNMQTESEKHKHLE